MEDFNKAQFYKVTNTASKPFHFPWVTSLMSDEDLKGLEGFESTADYKGRSEEDRNANLKIARAKRMKGFLRRDRRLGGIGHDVQIKYYEPKLVDGEKIIEPGYEWEFCIGPDTEKLIKENDLIQARQTCMAYDIPIIREDDVREIAKKLKENFGPNYKILTARQWEESGLQALERKEIKAKLEPGQLTATIRVEGYLTAEPLTDLDVEELNSSKKK